MAAVLVAVLALPFLCLGLATEARAHATLVSAEPADNEVLQTAPTRLTLRFSEPVKLMSLSLAAPTGETVALKGAEVDGTDVSVAVPANMAEGTHAIRYRIVSADSHPVGGSVLFSVGAPSGTPGRGDAPDWPVAALVFSSKLLLYLGLFVGIGGLAYGAAIQPFESAARRVVRVFLVLGLVAVPVALAAQGLDALGASIGAFFQPDSWAAGAETSFGRTLGIAAVSFLLGLAAAFLPGGRIGTVLAGLSFLGAGLSLAASGHASAAPPQWATRPAVFLHTLAIAFWVGSLLPLALAIQGGREEGRAALKRFSAAIPFVLLALVASGVLLGVVQVREPDALFDTAYGWVLVAKLGLVSLLLLLAAANRWSLTPAVAGGADRTVRERMVGLIGMELALVLLVLAVVAFWRFTPPPRALQEAARQPAVAYLVTGRLAAEVTLRPGRAGPVEASAALSTIDYVPIDPKGVTFVFTDPAGRVPPVRQAGVRSGNGLWQANAALPVPGRWQVWLEVGDNRVELEKVEGTIDVRP
ncbi:copper resistance CopC/CopD family protein [Aureimonas psammosilenae]|uniref:copper resistance CopC/CopD family protein n=1 Tax=Aureimonas psammosilenae TaxID=2495496 RepID=UPI00186A4ACE|nr:copper resistance protein CopC [Aureimonas psammosilenae]